jgi:hypothetical protein
MAQERMTKREGYTVTHDFFSCGPLSLEGLSHNNTYPEHWLSRNKACPLH